MYVYKYVYMYMHICIYTCVCTCIYRYIPKAQKDLLFGILEPLRAHYLSTWSPAPSLKLLEIFRSASRSSVCSFGPFYAEDEQKQE